MDAVPASPSSQSKVYLVSLIAKDEDCYLITILYKSPVPDIMNEYVEGRNILKTAPLRLLSLLNEPGLYKLHKFTFIL